MDTLNNCFSNVTFTHNLIIGGSKAWPPGNLLLTDQASAGIVDLQAGQIGDYRLCKAPGEGVCTKASAALGAGTDGKNLGVDLPGLQTAIAGVE